MDGDRVAGRLHRFSAADCHRMDEAGIPHEGDRFSVRDYYRLGEIGVLDEDSRVELIEGCIVDMNPIGTPHAAMVNRLTRILNAALAGRATISPQNPIRLLDGSEPQPDISVSKWRADDYARRHPGPQDILVVIEVADSSLGYDRDDKMPLYARGGIAECWIVNVVEWVVEEYRAPQGGRYAPARTARPGDVLEVAGIIFQVAELLGDQVD